MEVYVEVYKEKNAQEKYKHRFLSRVFLSYYGVFALILDWKEPEARNELYRQHLEKCGDVYDVAFRDISCAGNKMEGEFCLDPIGEYKLNCAKNRKWDL